MAKRQVARVMDYKRAFASEQGMRVLYDMMSSHHVLGSTYVKGDALDMAFREGQRQVVLRILTIMKTDPSKMEKLIGEANSHVSRTY